MYTQTQSLSDTETQQLRRSGGVWLRSLREARGLSQRDLAALVGIEYYTFVSQLERGGGRVPPDRYEVWAKALGVEAKSFVKSLMFYYDPLTYRLIFAGESPDHLTSAEPIRPQQASAEIKPFSR